MNFLSQINLTPHPHFKLPNYITSQIELLDLINDVQNGVTKSVFLKGTSGNGLTHLCHALLNQYVNHGKKVMVISSEWLAHFSLKLSSLEKELLLYEINEFEVLGIDNAQFNFSKSAKKTSLFYAILNTRQGQDLTTVLTCSDVKRDISRNKNFCPSEFKTITIKEPSSAAVFKALKENTSIEDAIPDALLYLISSYNGSFQEHLNCLISLRFRFQIKELGLENMSLDKIDSFFNLKQYFKKQQLRKCFFQYQIDFSKIKEGVFVY